MPCIQRSEKSRLTKSLSVISWSAVSITVPKPGSPGDALFFTYRFSRPLFVVLGGTGFKKPVAVTDSPPFEYLICDFVASAFGQTTPGVTICAQLPKSIE